MVGERGGGGARVVDTSMANNWGEEGRASEKKGGRKDGRKGERQPDSRYILILKSLEQTSR